MTTFAEHPPTVKFLGGPTNPLSIMTEAWCRSRDLEIPKDGTENRELAVNTWRMLAFEFTQIPEMVKYTWWIDDMPRSFFDQMTRYRKTGFFARSQRIRNQSGFAARGEYLTTPTIASHKQAAKIYRNAMRQIDGAYTKLIKIGVPAEEARGLLPLHLRTGFTWTLTLRDIKDVFRARTCHLLQQDYWAHIGERMRLDLCKIDEELGILFKPPCQVDGTCLSNVEAQARIKALGEGRMDLFPCRIYNEKFTPPEPALAVQRMVNTGQTRWASSMEEVLGVSEK